VEYLPLPQDDPMHRRPDATRAHALLSWEATNQLEDGLPKTVEYFRDLIQARDLPERALGGFRPPDPLP